MSTDDQDIESIVRTVRYNTGGPQPDSIDVDHLAVLLVANAKAMSRDELEDALDVAVEEGYLEHDECGYSTIDNR